MAASVRSVRAALLVAAAEFAVACAGEGSGTSNRASVDAPTEPAPGAPASGPGSTDAFPASSDSASPNGGASTEPGPPGPATTPAGAGGRAPLPEPDPTPAIAPSPMPEPDVTPEPAPTPSAPANPEPSIAPSPEPVSEPSPDGGMPGPAVAVDGNPIEETLEAVPVGRGEHGVAAVGGEVYVMCGFTPQVTASLQAYTPASDSWRDLADVPVVCHHPNVAVIDDKLYILGFHMGSGQRVADGTSFEYDPASDSWTELAPQPAGTERGASCVTSHQGKAYVFGGTNDIALPDASTYDPVANAWEQIPPLPMPRHHCIAAVVNDLIYIVSGRDVVISEVHTESFVYDPVSQSYEEVAPILTPRGGAAGGELGGRIFVFGGEGNVDDPNGIFHEAEVYDPASDSWQTLPDMNVPRHGFGAAIILGKIYLPGGSTSQGIDVTPTHSVFYFEP